MLKPKFKKGDLVVCITQEESKYSGYRKGCIYKVKSTYKGISEYRIKTETDSLGSTTNGWNEKHFEHAKVVFFNDDIKTLLSDDK